MSRVEAWRCVRAKSGLPMREVDREAARSGLDARDTGLLRTLVGLEVRRRATLRAILDHHARGGTSPELAAHLRLGIAQVLFLDRVPDHAAVSETVDAVARTVAFSKTKVANAVLRAVIRARLAGTSGDPRRDLVGRDLHLAEPVFRDPAEHPLLWAEDALSMPAGILKRWERRHGAERARALATYFLSEPPLCLRATGASEPGGIGGRVGLLERLRALGVPAEPGFHPDVVRVPAEHAADALGVESGIGADLAQGRVTVQGETALAAAELVGARPGETVLDLCAAPGGKTAALALAGAEVVAVDDDPPRVERLRATCARLGVAERVQIVVADAAAPLPEPFERTYDAVLVDAPCSNTGVLGARPGARWRFGPRELEGLCALQGRLLAAAAARVRSGGRLVWSTCSLEPEENGQMLRRFLADHPAFELDVEHEALPGPGPSGPADGGYAARMRRARE
jgi:16S rRNA (cytosine967-C5)-methyltransferase